MEAYTWCQTGLVRLWHILRRLWHILRRLRQTGHRADDCKIICGMYDASFNLAVCGLSLYLLRVNHSCWQSSLWRLHTMLLIPRALPRKESALLASQSSTYLLSSSELRKVKLLVLLSTLLHALKEGIHALSCRGGNPHILQVVIELL